MAHSSASLQALVDFIQRLERAGIHHSLAAHTEGAVMIIAAVPGERWEIDFRVDGDVEVEVFKSTGVTAEEAKVEELFARFSGSAPPETK